MKLTFENNLHKLESKSSSIRGLISIFINAYENQVKKSELNTIFVSQLYKFKFIK